MRRQLHVHGLDRLAEDSRKFNQPITIIAEVTVSPDGIVTVKRLKHVGPRQG